MYVFLIDFCFFILCSFSFVSTLLTAILTNHLGWVATVAPIINNAANSDHVITMNQNQAKMSEISKFHPYNVLWAQLGDLYGSIGNPSRLAKTVVCGAQNITINKVLSVLTYFVRCGEIQRVKSKKVLDKSKIEEMIKNKGENQKVLTLNESNCPNGSMEMKENQVKGLSRSKSCLKEITTAFYREPPLKMSNNSNSYRFAAATHNISLEKPAAAYDHDVIDNNIIKNAHIKPHPTNSAIKLLVTSPSNDHFEYETASEAIDFILKQVETSTNGTETTTQIPHTITKAKSDNHKHRRRSSLWSMDTVKDGISIEKWKSFTIDESNNTHIKNIHLRRSHSLKTKPSAVSHLRRSKTFREIKANEMQSDNNETSNESRTSENKVLNKLASLMQEVNSSIVPQSTYSNQTLRPTGGVVFVLGDNEVLSGLRTPPPSPNLINDDKIDCISMISVPLTQVRLDEPYELNPKPQNSQSNGESHSSSVPAATATTPKTAATKPEKKKKHCTHKKHSGVKFNFEQYPQIVTNYMKNKNLDITSYDFLEKGLKLEQENAFNYGASSTSFLPMLAPEDVQEHDEQEEEEQCECCANTFRILQTPSNATELEFSNDDAVYPVPVTPATTTPTPKQFSTLAENGSTLNECGDATSDCSHLTRIQIEANATDRPSDGAKPIGNSECTKKNENGQNPTNSSNCKGKECLDLITLPIPKTEIINDSKDHGRFRPGYVPSLFVGITDHFIPDMVLQVSFVQPFQGLHPIIFIRLHKSPLKIIG